MNFLASPSFFENGFPQFSPMRSPSMMLFDVERPLDLENANIANIANNAAATSGAPFVCGFAAFPLASPAVAAGGVSAFDCDPRPVDLPLPAALPQEQDEDEAAASSGAASASSSSSSSSSHADFYELDSELSQHSLSPSAGSDSTTAPPSRDLSPNNGSGFASGSDDDDMKAECFPASSSSSVPSMLPLPSPVHPFFAASQETAMPHDVLVEPVVGDNDDAVLPDGLEPIDFSMLGLIPAAPAPALTMPLPLPLPAFAAPTPAPAFVPAPAPAPAPLRRVPRAADADVKTAAAPGEKPKKKLGRPKGSKNGDRIYRIAAALGRPPRELDQDGHYMPEYRQWLVKRHREKRQERLEQRQQWIQAGRPSREQRLDYPVRQRQAQKRARIGGRFASKQEMTVLGLNPGDKIAAIAVPASLPRLAC